MTSSAPAGWYPDPRGGSAEWYFDGVAFTGDQRPASTPSPKAGPSSPAASSGTAGRVSPRRSLAQAYAAAQSASPAGTATGASADTSAAGSEAAESPAGFGVSSRSVQSLLVGSVPGPAAGVAASSTSVGAGSADRASAGWYPDPARRGGLRLFDGREWTSRSRSVPPDRARRMPAAALRLRARLLAAQDARYLRAPGRDVAPPVRVPRPSVRPSLAAGPARVRAGSVWVLLASVLVLVSLVASGYFSWELWGSNYYTRYEQSKLRHSLSSSTAIPVPVVPSGTSSSSPGRSQLPAAEPRPQLVVNTPGEPGSSTPLGRIRIPRIGLNMVFVMGTGAPQLALGPGLWRWGVMPGFPGNATISGHRTTYLHPFRYLNKLRYGDKIYIDIPGQPEAVFQVRGHTVASPFDVAVTGQTSGVRLTLTTCNPVGSASQRLVVEAEEISGKYAQYALPASRWKLRTK